MKYTLIVKPEAELDMLNSANWYEKKQEILGVRFIDEIEEKLRLLTQHPLHYETKYKNTHLALLEHFPYAIHFIVEEEKVIVLAVLGIRENPDKWH